MTYDNGVRTGEKRFGFRVPGMVYSETIYRDNEREVREYIRWRWNVKRCPAGTEVWDERG